MQEQGNSNNNPFKSRVRRTRSKKKNPTIRKANLSKRYLTTYNKTITKSNKRNRDKSKQTKPEKQVEKILVKHSIPFEKEYNILGMFYDFMIDLGEKKALIEVHGTYWHVRDIPDDLLKVWQIDRKINDIYKRAIAQTKNMTLIVIWEDRVNENKIIDAINQARSSTSTETLEI